MRFLVCRKMVGDGCDYTIGCGMRFDYIEADSIDLLVEKLVWPDGRRESSSLVGEMALSTILIVSAEHVTAVDVPSLVETITSDAIANRDKQTEEKERAELERLQAKYQRRSDGDR